LPSTPIADGSSYCRALKALITVHPSYLLRLREERDKRREFDRLVKDLQLAAEEARKPGP